MKRKGNLNDSSTNKRRKLNNNTKASNHNQSSDSRLKSALFEDTDDQKQFQQIYDAVNSSELIQNNNVPKGINKAISEYATGRWISCFKCKDPVSFLYHDMTHDTGVKCIACDMKLYAEYCFYHSQHCTVSSHLGSWCNDCDLTFCNDAMEECVHCDETVCRDCITSDGICQDCVDIYVLHINGYIEIV